MNMAADSLIAGGLCPLASKADEFGRVQEITLGSYAASRLGRANRRWSAGASASGYGFMHNAKVSP